MVAEPGSKTHRRRVSINIAIVPRPFRSKSRGTLSHALLSLIMAASSSQRALASPQGTVFIGSYNFGGSSEDYAEQSWRSHATANRTSDGLNRMVVMQMDEVRDMMKDFILLEEGAFFMIFLTFLFFREAFIY